MGRVKLKIKRLESSSNRQITYSKRRNGILKKAKELSILCGIDIVLLMFSPTEKPTIFQGENSNIEDVIAKFAQLTPQERAKRKLESLEALKKTFRKLDHDVVIPDFLGSSCQSVEELTDQVRLMQAHLSELKKRLSYWTSPDKVDNVEHLRQMEDSLRGSINQICLHKENLGKCTLMPLECNNQFHSGTILPLMMNGMQETQPLSWLPDNGNEHLVLSNGAHFLPQRDIQCSVNPSLPGLSGYYDTGKQTEIDNVAAVNNMRTGNGLFRNLNGNTCLNIELDEQFSYPPYSGLNLPEMKKPKHDMQMTSQENHSVYQVNTNFELPTPIYDNGHHHTWVPASGPCSTAMFNETSYHPQSN